MKKIFNVKTILIAIVMVFSFMLFLNLNTHDVEAAAVPPSGFGRCTTTNGAYSTEKEACKETQSSMGEVIVTKGGMINVKYEYGVTEVLVYAEACKEYGVNGLGNFTCNDDSDPEVWKGKKVVIHASGSSTAGSVTIHLYKYFEVNDLVRVKMIYQFMTTSGYFDADTINTAESGSYNPLYCDLNVGRYECGKFFQDTAEEIRSWKLKTDYKNKIKDYSIRERVAKIDELITENGELKPGISIERVDKNGIVYAGSTGLVNNFSESIVNGRGVYGVYVIISNTGSDEAEGNVAEIIYDTIIPVLLVVLSIGATVTIVVLGVQIIKGADGTGDRSEKIKQLRGILIGIAIAFIVLAAIEPLSNLMSKYGGGEK